MGRKQCGSAGEHSGDQDGERGFGGREGWIRWEAARAAGLDGRFQETEAGGGGAFHGGEDDAATAEVSNDGRAHAFCG